MIFKTFNKQLGITVKGKKATYIIKFIDGIYNTDDEDIIDAIKKHNSFGKLVKGRIVPINEDIVTGELRVYTKEDPVKEVKTVIKADVKDNKNSKTK